MKWTDFIKEVAEFRGIDLLSFDIEWLGRLLPNFSYDVCDHILITYIDVWSTAMAECDKPIQAMNVGRRAANIYLRELIDERNSEVL
jgi:hypothetical protein